MKKVKDRLLILLFMVAVCLFCIKDSGNVEAASADFSKQYFGEATEEGYIYESFTFNCKCKLTMRVDFPDTHFNILEIGVYDARYFEDYDEGTREPVFYDEISMQNSPYIHTITLPAGKYCIDVKGEKNDWYSNSDSGVYSLTLTGEYIPELSDKSLTLEEGKTKTLNVKGTKQTVKWKSSNKKIASVNNSGLITAKKAGKATITASFGQYSLKCKVTVKKKPVVYSQMANELRTFAKKNKNFTFQNIDVGKECRLYTGWTGKVEDSKIYSEGYAIGAMVRPYLQLVKKNKKTELRLRMQGRMDILSVRSTNLYCSGIQFETSGRRIKFAMKQTSERNTYNYSTHIYEGRMDGYITISTSSKVNNSNLKKLNTMLGQNPLYVHVVSKDGSYFRGGIPAKSRNQWKKLVKEYNTLLEEF